jgi:exonuclease SbcC
VLLTRLYVRNFRVYEEELDLALPPGLVGIYGPNGAGKSTLLEAIVFTLWGRARTAKEEIRSSGVGSDAVTEVEFEHEGHLYLVRRSLSGIAATVRAEARCDGLAMSEGVRDTARYLHSVLGMDDGAFRASVFAEQKQLAAFSSQAPAERRRLVLQLLGVTPLDAARDTARRDARSVGEQHQRLRALLPDLPTLELAAADADARAGAAESDSTVESEVAARAQLGATEAQAVFRRADELRQEYEALVTEGKAARQELDAAVALTEELRQELAQLVAAADELKRAEGKAAGRSEVEERLAGLLRVAEGARAVASVVVPPQPPEADQGARATAAAAAEAADAALARVEGELVGGSAELERARDAAQRSVDLSGEADCPLCGQELGAAYEAVQRHREAEVAEAEARTRALEGEVKRRAVEARSARQAFDRASEAFEAARQARSEWERARDRRSEAEAVLGAAWERLVSNAPTLAETLIAADNDRDGEPHREPAGMAFRGRTDVVDADVVDAAVARLEAELRVRQDAAAAAERLRGRLERRQFAEESLTAAGERASVASDRVERLREKLKALAFDPAALTAAREAAETATVNAQQAAARAVTSRETAIRARTEADGEARRFCDAVAQHTRLDELESDVRHLSRVADLLAEFRNTVVASVGPRLATQAAELFAELTDHEYDELQVDPETFQLQISDGGRLYGLDRFSGSEIDLANLALRVAISEHIRFQSGGSVGLLVLDEVFGPLDDERKSRMLVALERLRGRFRQILVVTHDPTIKEQLPNAIEVIKRPGRRATARVLAG